MRSAPLTTIRGGINRLRTKGGARADTLYDLLNGYVTEAGTILVRPGTERVATLNERTRGLCAFGGELYTFCDIPVDVPVGYKLAILVHPNPPDSGDYYATGDVYGEIARVPIKTIHFSEPFLGGLYVVAEFEVDTDNDGENDVYHYWLQPGRPWRAVTQYNVGDLVEPSVPNGFLYRAARFGDPYPPWQPDEPRYDGVGDNYEQSIVEPTTFNGFYYVCIETQGPNPRSGATEPTWPTFKEGTVVERTDTGVPADIATDSPPPPPAGGSTSDPVAQPDPDNPFSQYQTGFDPFNQFGGQTNIP
jgi:hypothetical protein